MAIARPVTDHAAAHHALDAESLKAGFANRLKYDLALDQYSATTHDRYLALAKAVRDRLVERWITTQQTHYNRRAKRVYYLSLEFLVGRSLGNNVINLQMEGAVREAMSELGLDWVELRDEEVDAGLGNGGLGRLAACFLESMATLQIPAIGYGLRYEHGIFRQAIQNGHQVEEPDNWLQKGNPWEIIRPDRSVPIRFGGRVEFHTERGRQVAHWVDGQTILGIPYDTPIVGYGGKTVNTLRLWGAASPEAFDFQDFNQGDYIAAVESKMRAENLTKVLYPNDNVYEGKELRLKQQYFFVACSLNDILRRFRKNNDDWNDLPDQIAIQLNDTHPALAIPELLRLLTDEHGLEWDHAWDLTVRSMGYTNHTLLPEALERWPVDMLERLLPRHLQIMYRINQQLIDRVLAAHPGHMDKVERMSLVEERPYKQIRMANLCIFGSHSTNGVAALHSELLKSRVVPDFAQMFPERFSNKTNGVTQRRWLLKANPTLATLISDAIGDKWITDLSQLRRLAPLAEDVAFRQRFRAVKRKAKTALADYLKHKCGFDLDPDSIFDIQIKRIHEYKRQLLNALHIVALYHQLKTSPDSRFIPRTFLFAGKAAPGYFLAKLIIKLINNIGAVVNHDPDIAGRIKVYFVPDYRVSLAERLIPAADLSEQISTAGTEASGTGNMKFMLNGALTIGTLDGANIEIVEEVGREHAFIFGLTAEEVATLRPSYNPHEYYQKHPLTRAALDLIFNDHFSRDEPGIFSPLRATLLDHGDHYMHLADLPSYMSAQAAAQELYRETQRWCRSAILNVGCSGKFSSDRTIEQYAREIWNVKPCPIKK